jgi:hypothetical protein
LPDDAILTSLTSAIRSNIRASWLLSDDCGDPSHPCQAHHAAGSYVPVLRAPRAPRRR